MEELADENVLEVLLSMPDIDIESGALDILEIVLRKDTILVSETTVTIIMGVEAVLLGPRTVEVDRWDDKKLVVLEAILALSVKDGREEVFEKPIVGLPEPQFVAETYAVVQSIIGSCVSVVVANLPSPTIKAPILTF